MATEPSPTTKSAQQSHLKASSNKEFSGSVIFPCFVNCLGLPPNVDLKKPISKILAGGLVNWDIGLRLMAYAPFKRDGLILQKADVMRAATIGRQRQLLQRHAIGNERLPILGGGRVQNFTRRLLFDRRRIRLRHRHRHVGEEQQISHFADLRVLMRTVLGRLGAIIQT